MTEKSKTIVVVAGLGKFYGAGRRLNLQLRELRPEIEPVLIDAQKLSEIAKQNRVNEKLFSPDIRGYGSWQWKPLVINHFLSDPGVKHVVYIDAGCDIAPASLMHFIRWFDRSPFKLVLAYAKHNISKYTKPEVIKELGVSIVACRRTQMLNAGFISVKTGSNIATIFKDACEMIRAQRQDIFDDEMRDYLEPNSDFVDHRHDQSILTLLILRSPHIKEVGVLPTDLTPPHHNDWSKYPPIIQTRNVTCVSLYWPLMKYGSVHNFPKVLRLQIRLMERIAKLFGYSSWIIGFTQKLMEIRYRVDVIESFSNFSETSVLTPPTLISNVEK